MHVLNTCMCNPDLHWSWWNSCSSFRLSFMIIIFISLSRNLRATFFVQFHNSFLLAHFAQPRKVKIQKKTHHKKYAECIKCTEFGWTHNSFSCIPHIVVDVAAAAVCGFYSVWWYFDSDTAQPFVCVPGEWVWGFLHALFISRILPFRKLPFMYRVLTVHLELSFRMVAYIVLYCKWAQS